MALSLRARSCDRILRSKFFRAKTRFSEFLMWWVCSRLISRSIPLDCIFLCKNFSARSRFPFSTFTRIPLHCCCWQWRFCRKCIESVVWIEGLMKHDTFRANEFISRVWASISPFLQPVEFYGKWPPLRTEKLSCSSQSRIINPKKRSGPSDY